MVPSSSYNTIRPEIGRFWNCHETKQVWYDERFFNWNPLWLWNLFAILNVRVLCRWSCSTMTVPAPTWFWYSPACTSFIEMESQWLGWRSCSGASAAWSGPRLGTSRSSTSPSRSPSTRCSYAYLVEFRNFYINIDNIRRRHLLNIHNMRTKKVSSQDTLCFIHTSIPDCWLCRKNLRFHLKNCLQPQRGQWSESCRCWTPRCGCRRTMRRPVSPVSPAWTWPSW